MPDAPKLRYSFKHKPWDHQLRALGKLNKLDWSGALFMPMRTGKTKVAVDAAGIGFHNFGVRRVLVVAPATVLDVWRREIEAQCPVPSTVVILDGSVTGKARTIANLRYPSPRLTNEAPPDELTWLLINYEATWRSGRAGPRGGTRKIEDLLVEWKPDLIIADEAHKLKTPTAKQSKAVVKIARAARYRLALTGTPITRSPLDAYGLFKFVDETVMADPYGKPFRWSSQPDTGYTGFKDYYGRWGGYGGKELIGIAHVKDLTDRIRAHSFRVKLEDCFDLPERTFIDTPVRLSVEGMRIYRDMAKEMIVEIEEGKYATASIPPVKLLRLNQITSGFLVGEDKQVHEFDTAKLDACMGIIDEAEAADEKVVVFCRFLHDVAAVARACAQRGLLALQLTGATPQRDRDPLIERFSKDRKARMFVSQIATGSMGIDLTAARITVMYSFDHKWVDYAQAIERTYGPKQTRPVVVHHLLATNTLNRGILNVLKARGDLSHAVIHDPRKLLGFDPLDN